MATLAPAALEAGLRERIEKLAEDWGVQVASPLLAPALGCQAVPPGPPQWSGAEPVQWAGWEEAPMDTPGLVPEVRVRSSYAARAHRVGLCCAPPVAERSPWQDRYQPPAGSPTDPQAREALLQRELHARRRRCPERLREREALPIWGARAELLRAVRSSRFTLVTADTGSGKSTQVPQWLLDDAVERGQGAGVHVVCTQPRRVAALALAERVAWERGEGGWQDGWQDGWQAEPAGASVGHVVRWEERPPRPWGSIVFCTVGALLPRLARLGASHIVVDEAHTREMHTDFLLTVLKDLANASPSLRVVVMSATCDVHKLRTYFGDDCAIVEARGRSFEVRELYLEDVVEELAWRPPRPQHGAAAGGMPVSLTSECRAHDKFEDRSGALSAATVETVRSLQEWVLPLGLIAAILAWVARSEAPGSVLVFLPGWREIAACAALLSQDPQLRGYEVVRLHSTVPPDEQRRALGPAGHGRRKAILSTDIAETSVTIPDVVCVVDSGMARVKWHNSLEVMWASKANLVQRRGRAGRVRDGTCVHLITRARFEALDAEPEPEMRRVPLEEVMVSVCDLGLDGAASEESFRELGAHAGVAKFLEGAPDPPDTRNVRRAFYELMHLGVLDHQGYLTHLGALLARLPLPPRLGAALFLGGLLGAADAASLVAAAVEGREPWARRRDSDGGGSAARRFARGPGLTDEPWSDVFCSANALASFCTCGASAYRSRWASQNRFCNDHSLVLPVMQQMASAREQLSNSLREMGCDSGPCAQEVAAPAALIQDWPLMQTVLTFFGGEKLAELEGGRRAHAGWAKPARLEKSSVLCGGGGGAEEEPPSPLLAYADYSCGSGGKMLRGATMVTPLQMLLFGGRHGPRWDGRRRSAVFGGWLHVRAEPGDAAALGSLRAVTALVMQHAAKEAMRRWGSSWSAGSDEWLQQWRQCVVAVARSPAPARGSLWAPRPSPTLRAHAVPGQAPLARAAAAAAEVAPSESTLPFGWAAHVDAQAHQFFACQSTGESRWARPASEGPDGSAALWRWASRGEDGVCYLRTDCYHAQLQPPRVGDSQLLPLGWEAVWDAASQRHYYWSHLKEDGFTTWEVPQRPLLEVDGELARRFLEG